MENQICQNCRFFARHYSIRRGKLVEIYCGHCIHPATRLSGRGPDIPSCKRFILRDSQEEKMSRNNLFRDTVSDMRERLIEILLILSKEDA